MKKIVILGAGFGGIGVLTHLHKLFHQSKEVEITIVNKTNYFLFTPLLHEVATGNIDQYDIVLPIRHLSNCCLSNLWQATVAKIDLQTKTVYTTLGELEYDYLVLGMGAEPNYFNVSGAQEHTYTLKTLPDAIALRNRFISVFEHATHTADLAERKKLLSFAVVGGGSTGVELVAEMAEYFYETFCRLYKNMNAENEVSITLVHRGKELMQDFDSSFRQKALTYLQKKKVNVLLATEVTKVEENALTLNTGQKLLANTIIWTAGVKSVEPNFFPQTKLEVLPTLQLKDHENVFVLGDLNANYPMFAQTAKNQAPVVAQNIKQLLQNKPLVTYTYTSRGHLVSLGKWMALGKIGRFTFSGKVAWWVWRAIYLTIFISWSKRLKLMLNWFIDLFLPRDISQA